MPPICRASVEATPHEPPVLRVLTIVSRPLDVNALPDIGEAWSLFTWCEL